MWLLMVQRPIKNKKSAFHYTNSIHYVMHDGSMRIRYPQLKSPPGKEDIDYLQK